LKSIADAKGNVLKNRQNYEKLMKEVDALKDALIKAEKDEINQPENKKLQQVTRKCSENFNGAQTKAKSAESAYKTSVEKTNEELNTFKSERMPAVLEQMQALETERWNYLLSIVKSYKSIQEVLPTSYQKELTEIQTFIEAANIDNDIKEIITTCKKEKDEDKVEFVVFKSKHEDLNTPTTSDTTTTSSTSSSSSSSTSSSSSSSSSSEKKVEKPKETSKEKETDNKDGSTFGTQTAEEQIQSQQKEAVKPTESKESAEEKRKKEEANKQKASEVKANLFGNLDDEKDFFN